MKFIIFKIGHFPLTSETFVVNHIVETIKMGFEVKIMVQKLVDLEMGKYGSLMEKYNIKEKIIYQDYSIPEKRFPRLLKAFLILFTNLSELCSILNYYKVKKKYNFSVLFEWIFFKKYKDASLFHVQYGTNSKPLDDLKKSGYYKMPVIVTFHGHDSFFPIGGYIKKEGYYNSLFETAELFTANTPYLREQLIAIDCPAEKIVTIPLPVNTSYFIPRKFKHIIPENILLLSVGRLEKIKGHHLGIEAVNMLVKKGYNITYKIIGEGSRINYLQELIEKLFLGDKIKLLGAFSHQEIRKSYYEADIFLMTSTVVNGDTRETQGLVSLEAQACGCPVIGFSSGGVFYTIKNKKTGFLIAEENVSQFAEKLEKLINDEVMYKTMALNAPAFVKNNYSMKKVTAEWEMIYNKYLQES